MKTVPKFSIVTPSYNQAAFIGVTIESVLSQAGAFEIEYRVMDGGSTDGSVDVIRRYAEQVQAGTWPVRCAGLTFDWVSQRDGGQSDAINQGLRRATGDILSYINSDDAFVPGAFEQVAQALAQSPEADFIYGDGDVIDEHGGRQWEWLSRPYDHGLMTSYHFLWNDFTNYIMQQSTFWRRRVLDRIGYFDESFHFAMDAEYWIRAGHAGLKLQHIPHKLGLFRLIQGTKSLSSPTAFWADYLEIFRRYRRRGSLSLVLAYFYFNLARQLNFDLGLAWEQGQAAQARWEELPAPERQSLKRQAWRGFNRACVLAAIALRREGRDAQAAQAFRQGLRGAPLLMFHPFAVWYGLRRLAGSSASARLEAWGQQLVRWYRWHRYEYRYHPQRGG